MRYLNVFLIVALLAFAGCKDKGAAPAKIKDDQILAAYQKEIRQLNEDAKLIQEHAQETKKKLKDLSMNPKISEILKKGLFQNQRFLEQIDQRISFIKIQMADRESFLNQNKGTLTQETVDQQYADYLIDKKANPSTTPWKTTPLTDLENPGSNASMLDGDKKEIDSPEKANGASSPGKDPNSH